MKTHKNKIWSGVNVINIMFMRYFPYNFIFIWFYIIPLFLLIEMIIYRFIAKNRHSVSKWFGLSECRFK